MSTAAPAQRTLAPSTPAESKRQEIVALAFERFYEGGFHATGIDALMADSGISKRTLYKYFPSKEDLIEAVLDHYGSWVVTELFDPLTDRAGDPLAQIIELFAARKALLDDSPTRGCLGMMASQEYVGKHAGIAARGRGAAQEVERRFVGLCRRAGLAAPDELGAQIAVLFQGAVVLARGAGDSAAFAAAEGALRVLLAHAGARVPAV